MDRRPVISSHIAAVGHEAGIMEVEFRDGTVYACAATDKEVMALMFAKSMGSHLQAVFSGRLVKQVGSGPAPAATPPPAVASGLDIVKPDPCCSSHLLKAIRQGKAGSDWVCPKCGAGWLCRIDGETRVWTPDDVLELIRLKEGR